MATPFITDAEATQKIQQSYSQLETQLDAAVFESVKTYDSLADAQAVDPKPDDGTVFQVSEVTDPANAGYYSFQSSELEGTRFERYSSDNFSKGVFDTTATINSEYPDVFKAIKKVELYNADPTKKYYLKTFARNRESNGAYYIIIEEEGHSNITGVAYYNTVLTENPNGVNVIELIESDGSGIIGKVWIDWNEIALEEYPGLVSYTINQTQLNSIVHKIKEERILTVESKVNGIVYDYFNSVLELGGVNTTNGDLNEAKTRVRSKEKIPVVPGNYEWHLESSFGLDFHDLLGYKNGVYVGGITKINIGDYRTFIITDSIDSVIVTFRKPDNSEISEVELKDLSTSIFGLDSSGYNLFQKEVKILKKQTRPFLGKKLTVLGDSISYGFIPRNAVDYPGQLNSYAKLAAESLGMSFENKGISGSTLGSLTLGGTVNNPFVYRYDELDDISDVILVMGGTNDITKGIPIGTFSDTDETTFYGALKILAEGLIKKYRHDQGLTLGKNKKIAFCTPIKKLNYDLEPYSNAVKEVAEYYSLPVWDAYNLSGINPHILRTVQGTEQGYTDIYNPYITDGTHPTQEGHEMMANSLVGFLKTI